jgi:hypothetical protein
MLHGITNLLPEVHLAPNERRAPAYPRGAGGSVSNGMRKWSKLTLRSFWQLLADFVAKVGDQRARQATDFLGTIRCHPLH